MHRYTRIVLLLLFMVLCQSCTFLTLEATGEAPKVTHVSRSKPFIPVHKNVGINQVTKQTYSTTQTPAIISQTPSDADVSTVTVNPGGTISANELRPGGQPVAVNVTNVDLYLQITDSKNPVSSITTQERCWVTGITYLGYSVHLTCPGGQGWHHLGSGGEITATKNTCQAVDTVPVFEQILTRDDVITTGFSLVTISDEFLQDNPGYYFWYSAEAEGNKAQEVSEHVFDPHIGLIGRFEGLLESVTLYSCPSSFDLFLRVTELNAVAD